MIIIKKPEEIEHMRHAGRTAAEVLRIVCDSVVPGITTKELDNIALSTMNMLGVKSAFLGYMGYPAQTCISINEMVIHGIPGSRVVKEGDIVSVDVGVWCEGFVGDNAKTVLVGAVGPDTMRLVTGTEKALAAGIAAVRDGARLGDVSNAVERTARDNRLSVVRDYVGHGCGRHMHEDPAVPNFGPAGRGPILRSGMVICIEPMLNLGTHRVKTVSDGWGVVTADGRSSAHFEHMIAVTGDGAEILTPR